MNVVVKTDYVVFPKLQSSQLENGGTDFQNSAYKIFTTTWASSSIQDCENWSIHKPFLCYYRGKLEKNGIISFDHLLAPLEKRKTIFWLKNFVK